MDHINIGRKTVRSALLLIDHPIVGFILDSLDKNEPIKVDICYKSCTPHSCLQMAQALALVSKNPWLFDGSSEVADRNALQKWLEAEAQCKIVNDTFCDVLKEFKTRSLLETARHFVHKILGPLTIGTPDFGPGASFLLKGKDATLVSKLETLPECTALAHRHVYEIMKNQPHYALSSGMVNREKGSLSVATTKLPLVPGNRLAFVPKTVTVSRAMCIEPLGNLFAQKAYSDIIRKCLKKWGLDLGLSYSGVERQLLHREWARSASIDGNYATIDLSSASDTIATEFVRFMLPPDWFEVLDQIRCRRTVLPSGELHSNEKFSSMGNGFTFELETLLFYSLVLACRYTFGNKGDIASVFGDDIIVHRNYAEELVTLLSKCGFTVNQDKSFLDGPFRESCGGDFLNGVSVRPVFFKMTTEAKATFHEKIVFLYQLANRLLECCYALGSGTILDVRFRSIWARIIRAIPQRFRCFGPRELGDDVLTLPGNEQEYRSSWKRKSNILSIARISRICHGRVLPSRSDSELTYALYGGSSSGVTPRNSTYILRKRHSTVQRKDCDWHWY